MSQLDSKRAFFADFVAATGGVRDERVRQAFHAEDRLHYCGPGPWWVAVPDGYVQTPTDDPAFVYQDIVISLIRDQGINNGGPSFHARCLDAVRVQPGDRVTHVGAGSGYYTALLARLAGPDGLVTAYEIEPQLAHCARGHLVHHAQVSVLNRSGVETGMPMADVIYVSAGATEPMAIWLDNLKPGGRLIFPLTPDHGYGGMLLVTRTSDDKLDARFVSPARFFPCIGARRAPTARTLFDAFRRGSAHLAVRSLRRGGTPDSSCWANGQDWWLSTQAVL